VSARVLLTGATGAFGRRLAAALHDHGCELVLLTRGSDERDARSRATRTMGRSGPRVQVVTGDLGQASLGLSGRGLRLARSADLLVHAAATTDFLQPLEETRRINVGGTRNLLDFAASMPALERVVYVSTAFVAGKRTGLIAEEDSPDTGPGFVTAYERTKHEAESLLKSWDGAPTAVLRPSVVIEPRTARDATAFWFVLSLIARDRLPALPALPATRLDVIPSPDAAVASAELALLPDALGVFHIATGSRAPLVADIVRIGADRRVRLIGREAFAVELESLRARHPAAGRAYDGIQVFIDLLAFSKIFDTSRTEAALGRPACVDDPLDAIAPAGLRSAAR
jgi:nucleoside-diphosphate-sugar epimerase